MANSAAGPSIPDLMAFDESKIAAYVWSGTQMSWNYCQIFGWDGDSNPNWSHWCQVRFWSHGLAMLKRVQFFSHALTFVTTAVEGCSNAALSRRAKHGLPTFAAEPLRLPNLTGTLAKSLEWHGKEDAPMQAPQPSQDAEFSPKRFAAPCIVNIADASPNCREICDFSNLTFVWISVPLLPVLHMWTFFCRRMQ